MTFCFARRFERSLLQRLDATSYQDDIDGKTVQPGGKCRLRPKCLNFSKYLTSTLLNLFILALALRYGRFDATQTAKSV
jgi:hypothetical protein